jgi:hypothetical protein
LQFGLKLFCQAGKRGAFTANSVRESFAERAR